ncbi:MAG: purine-nucleoside phosphorylase [Lachnospiraceae bacterium]|nr:purine-nucleoside phosphorylase [Lachnospiraceae bacterium]
MATPHNEADKGIIAKTVLMPGDPLRAEFIANTYLEQVVKFNNVRNMYGFTGKYKDKEVSVMGSGMGMPSIGIYSYELYTVYDVENIIRIGSAGSYCSEADIYDVVLASEAYSESSYAKVQNGYDKDKTYPSEKLNQKILDVADRTGIPVIKGCVHSSDVFYREDKTPYYQRLYEEKGCIAVEMESFALFHNASVLKKNASCILTISDSFVSHKETTSDERQKSFVKMMELALETAVNI